MRLRQSILIFSTLLASWLGMQAVHELGHVLGAWATGAKVTRVVLHPLKISRTDVSPNPRPLAVVWAGPVFGAIAPVLLWLAAAGLKMRGAFLLRFFAGFCLIANGLYLGAGSFDRVGDCGDLLRHGAALWQLWLFGLIATPAGFFLWHGQGKHFGFGPNTLPISRGAVAGVMVACLALLALGFTMGL